VVPDALSHQGQTPIAGQDAAAITLVFVIQQAGLWIERRCMRICF